MNRDTEAARDDLFGEPFEGGDNGAGCPQPRLTVQQAIGPAHNPSLRPTHVKMPGEVHSAPGNEVTTMLADAMLVTTVAVTDLERAKRFFHEQLGLSPLEETPFAIRFAAGKGTQFSVRRGQPNAGQTVGHFEVDDLESVVRDLTARGVTFEEYESPKTINFIAQIGPARGAWFKDPDGNVFGVREGPVPSVA